jgi:hypothetical protein
MAGVSTHKAYFSQAKEEYDRASNKKLKVG